MTKLTKSQQQVVNASKEFIRSIRWKKTESNPLKDLDPVEKYFKELRKRKTRSYPPKFIGDKQ